MLSIRNILVPTDFSETALHALQYAVELAKAADAKIFILHTFLIPESSDEVGFQALDNKFQQEKRSVLNRLELVARQHVSLQGVNYKCLVESGPLPNVANEVAYDYGIDLLVMGTNGATGIRKFIGTNAVDVIKSCICPVLTIPKGFRFKGIHSILFANDNKRLKEGSVLNPLINVAQLFKAEVMVLHIENEEEAKREKDAPEVSAVIENSLRSIKYTYFSVKAVENSIKDTLLNLIKSRNMDLLVMVPREHSLLDRFLRKSVTSQIAFQSEVPLLTFHEWPKL